jgi:hypothetical protein
VLFGLLAAFTAAETALRIFHVRPLYFVTKRGLASEGVYYLCYPSNPNGEFIPVPDTSRGKWHLYNSMLPPTEIPLEKIHETPWCVEFRCSSQGLRDREYSPTPPPGTLRIAGIGDSFAVGEGVQLNKTLFKWMEALLGPGFEVVNAGSAGINLGDEIQLLQGINRDLHCTRAIVVFIPNDVELTPELDNRQRYINDLINIRDEYMAAHERTAWYAGTLRVFELVGSHFERRRITRSTIQWYRDSYDPRKNGANVEKLAEGFRTLAAMSECKVALVIYPLMERVGGGYPLQEIHDKVSALAREAGLPVLDLAPVFRGRRSAALQVHPSDHHPNGRAHGIAAKEILDWLRSEVPGFLAGE